MGYKLKSFHMLSIFFVVGNIPYEATEEQLKDIFSEVGPVVSFRWDPLWLLGVFFKITNLAISNNGKVFTGDFSHSSVFL